MNESSILLLIALIAPLNASSQSQADWWYFGDSAGVHFTSNGPQTTVNSAMWAAEGCASISNDDGDLLFYTNGITVWNAQHDTLLNGDGLLGGASSTQAATIFGDPYSSHKFYIITTKGVSGLRYSIVDMNLDGGLGGINSGYKNVQIDPQIREKVAVISHSNKSDIWIVSARYSSNLIVSYKVSSSGISLTPIVSATPDTLFNTWGYLKANRTGNLLVNVQDGEGKVALYQFDNMTGAVVGSTLWIQDTLANIPFFSTYGAEFSPNGQLLYTASRSWLNGSIRQYDVSVFDSAAIHSSEVLIAGGPATGGLQLGPDQRIYVSQSNTSWLGRIEYPNLQGVSCGFQSQVVNLQSGVALNGLPNYAMASLETEITSKGICDGDTIHFRSNLLASDSLRWAFDDPTSGVNNTDTGFTTYHLFTDTGVYQVMLIAYQAGGLVVDTFYHEVHIFPRQYLDLGSDTVLCTGDTLVLDITQDYTEYLWNDGSVQNQYTVVNDETVSVTISGICDTLSDDLVVQFIDPLYYNFPDDTTLCQGDTLLLELNLDSLSTFTWSTGDSVDHITISNNSEIDWEIINACGIIRDSMRVSFMLQPDGFLPADSIYCKDRPFYLLNSQSEGVSYLWSDSSSGPDMRIDSSDTYWLMSFNECDTVRDEFTIKFNGEPKITLGNDTFICPGSNLKLHNLDGSASEAQSILWSNGHQDSTLFVEESGLYVATVTLGACKTSDSIQISIKQFCPERCRPTISNVLTPNADGINDLFKVGLTCLTANFSIWIYNRWGQLVHFGTFIGHDWDGTINGSEAPEGTYFYVLSFTDEEGAPREFRGSFALFR